MGDFGWLLAFMGLLVLYLLVSAWTEMGTQWPWRW
jgi:hypothetical protein